MASEYDALLQAAPAEQPKSEYDALLTAAPAAAPQDRVPESPSAVAQEAAGATTLPEDARQFLNTSIVPNVDVRVPQQEGLMQIPAAISNIGGQLGESLTTPTNLALMAALPARGVGRLAQALFAGQALADIPAAYREATAPDKTLQQRIESGGRGLIDVLFGATLARGAVKGLRGELPPTRTAVEAQPLLAETNSALAKLEKPPVQDRQLLVQPERRFTLAPEPRPEIAPVQPLEQQLEGIATSREVPQPPPQENPLAPNAFPSISRSAENARRIAQTEADAIEARRQTNVSPEQWFRDRTNEGQTLGRQIQTLQDAGLPIPKPLADRVSQINQELREGFKPPEPPAPPAPEPPAEAGLRTGVQSETARIGEPNATQEGQIKENIPTERPRDGEGGTSAEAGVGGGVRPTAEGATQEAPVAGTETTVPSAQPETHIAKEKPPVQTAPGVELKPATVEQQPEFLSRIAKRFDAERAETGKVPEMQPGQGTSTRMLVAEGAKMQPEEVAQHVSDLMQDKGNLVEQGKAVRVEEARLSDRSHQMSRYAEDHPLDLSAKAEADNAFKDLADFRQGPVAKLRVTWSDAGRGLQGEVPVDLSTYNGLRENFLRETGERPGLAADQYLRRTAKRVREADVAEQASVSKYHEAIDRATSRRKLPSYDEIRDSIVKRMEDGPCPV